MVYIRNSDNVPSIEYVKSRNCLTACEVAGNDGNTLFLAIEGDSLREFANVSTETDANGTIAKAYKTDKTRQICFLTTKKYKLDDNVHITDILIFNLLWNKK